MSAILCSPDSFFKSPNNHVRRYVEAISWHSQEGTEKWLLLCSFKTGDPTVSIFVHFKSQQYIFFNNKSQRRIVPQTVMPGNQLFPASPRAVQSINNSIRQEREGRACAQSGPPLAQMCLQRRCPLCDRTDSTHQRPCHGSCNHVVETAKSRAAPGLFSCSQKPSLSPGRQWPLDNPKGQHKS